MRVRGRGGPDSLSWRAPGSAGVAGGRPRGPYETHQQRSKRSARGQERLWLGILGVSIFFSV